LGKENGGQRYKVIIKLKKVLYVSRNTQRCGVHDYGERIVDIFKNSKKYKYIVSYPNNNKEFLSAVFEHRPDAVIYNYHFATLYWLNQNTKEIIDTPQIMIYHESNVTFEPDGICKVDCTGEDDLENNIVHLPRPLHDNLQQTEFLKYDVPVIGSFGFGFANKNFPTIAQLVKDQFEDAVLRLSIPYAEFGDNDGRSAHLEINKIENILSGTKIKLEVNHNFLDTQQLYNFLSNNDLNVFCYDIMPGRSISGSTDYALSVKKPIALSRSNMFNHFHKYNLDIYVDQTPLKKIMEMGIEQLQPMYNEHCNSNILDKIETVISKAIAKGNKNNSWIKF
jgi:hypothetical protein